LIILKFDIFEGNLSIRPLTKGGFTQNPVTAYEPAYGQRESSHMQQEHHHRQPRQSGLLKPILSGDCRWP